MDPQETDEAHDFEDDTTLYDAVLAFRNSTGTLERIVDLLDSGADPTTVTVRHGESPMDVLVNYGMGFALRVVLDHTSMVDRISVGQIVVNCHYSTNEIYKEALIRSARIIFHTKLRNRFLPMLSGSHRRLGEGSPLLLLDELLWKELLSAMVRQLFNEEGLEDFEHMLGCIIPRVFTPQSFTLTL